MVFLSYNITTIFLNLIGIIETMVTNLFLMSERLSQMIIIYFISNSAEMYNPNC